MDGLTDWFDMADSDFAAPGNSSYEQSLPPPCRPTANGPQTANQFPAESKKVLRRF